MTLGSDLSISNVVTILTCLHYYETGCAVSLAADDLSSSEGVRALELGERNDAYDRTNNLSGAALSIVVYSNVCIYLTGSKVIVVSAGSGLGVSTLSVILTVGNGVTIGTASGGVNLGSEIVAKGILNLVLVLTTNLTYLVGDTVGLTGSSGGVDLEPSVSILSDVLLTVLTILGVVASVGNLLGMILIIVSYIGVTELLNFVSSLVILCNELELTVLDAGNLAIFVNYSLRKIGRLLGVICLPSDESATVYASVDSVLTNSGASNLGRLCLENELACSVCIVECSLRLVVVLAIALSVDGYFLGCAAILSGTNKDSKTIGLSGGFGNNLFEFPTCMLANFSTLGVEGAFADSTNVSSLAAYAGNEYEVMELSKRNSLFLSLATNGTVIVTEAVLTLCTCGNLGVLVIFIKNPLVAACSNDVAEELFAALGTLETSPAGVCAICFLRSDDHSITVCNGVYCGAGSINGNCRKRRRRYERQNHERCQHKRKNLFHVFFPFEKMFLGVRHAMLRQDVVSFLTCRHKPHHPRISSVN